MAGTHCCFDGALLPRESLVKGSETVKTAMQYLSHIVQLDTSPGWTSISLFCNISSAVGSISLKHMKYLSEVYLQYIEMLNSSLDKVWYSILVPLAYTYWKLLLLFFICSWLLVCLLQKGIGYFKRDKKILLMLFDMVKTAHDPEMVNKVIALLKKTEVDVNAQQPHCESQMSLFLCACFSRNRRLVEYMIAQGAGVNGTTAWKDSPLHLATFAYANQNTNQKDLGVVVALIQAGSDVNSQNWHGNTPLSVAASSGKEHLIRFLISQGADPTICNNDGIYPIDFATNAGHINAAKMLALDVPNPHVWDFIEPHTPPRIKLGLQSPNKRHLMNSTITRKKMDFTR